MQSLLVVLLLATVAAVALAEGEFYVPRAYYIIDAEGHASAPVPLRRLRRSVPYPYVSGANANANANADARATGWVNANANANAHASAGAGAGGFGGWGVPGGIYGSSNPNALRH